MGTLLRTVILFALISAPAMAADISGKWIFQVDTDAGSGSPTFVFKQAGEKISGTYSGLFGTAELAGTVKGEDIEFSFEAGTADQKAKITYKGKIDSAAKMHGTADFGSVGSGTWVGTKQ